MQIARKHADAKSHPAKEVVAPVVANAIVFLMEHLETRISALAMRT